MDKRQPTVLIAAGAPESRAALRETLLRDRVARYSVIEAETASRALELRRERSPDCLILDQGSLDLSGLDLLKLLAAEDESLACAVVVLVPTGATRLAVEAMKSGARECLESDRAHGDELRRAVSNAIEKTGQWRVKLHGPHGFEEWSRLLKVEEELRRSEEEFRSLFDLSAIGMAQVSPSGHYLRVNRKLCQMLGYSEQEMLQLTLHDVTHPDDREVSAARLDSSFTGRPDEYSIEKRYVRKDGEIIWVLINWEVIRDSKGQPMHTVANVQDITARRRAEEALRANEAQLRAILDNSAAVIFVKDIEGRYLRINRWYEVVRGLTEADVKGKTDYDLYSRETADAVRANDQEVIAANTPLQFEEHVALADGVHHFIAMKFPLHDDSGRPYAVCGIATDITDRKQAEEALKASEERLDLAMQAGDVGTFDWDLRTNVVIWTEKSKAIFGMPSSTITGVYLDWRERVHPEDIPRCEASIREAFEKKLQDWSSQYRMIRDDTSEVRWIDSQSRIFYDAQGAPLRMIGTNIDITERKQAEEALKASEERFRSLVERASDGIFVADVEGTYTEVNTSGCQMLGYSREDLIGKKITDLLPPEDFPRLDALRERLLKGDTDLGEWWLRRKDGRYLLTEVSTKIFSDGRWHAIVRDITERKRAEDILRESEARFRQLADAMPQIVYTCGPDGATDYVNQQWREYVGLATEQAIGSAWIEAIHPDDRARVWNQWMKSLADGQSCESEYRLRRKNGQYRWRLSRTLPVRDERGQIVKWTGTSTDIHDRKQVEAEREELLAREQAAREVAEAANRSKDEFLAVVSHELRSPLNAMLGYARLLRYGPIDAQKVEQAVEIIERNGKAQSQLIDDLLDTASIISGKLRLDIGPVDIAAVIREAVQAIYPAADAKGLTLQADLAPEVGQITGDSVRLQQLVWNLLSNAVKFTPAGGRVEVRLERIDPHVCIIVSDTGKGISPDFMPYIFDRFRQADASSVRRYGGLGLGLALVKYLVELHGGTIEARSAGDDQGATFKVLLPVRAVSSPLRETEGAPVTISGLEEAALLAGVRALVVDDETDARELVRSALTQYGADVVAACSATEAYELVAAAPARELPDVMVTDLGMPDEDGFSLLRRVRAWERERNLYIPAVALTAYGRVEDRVRALRAGFQTHIAKPVEPAELAVVIASLVRRPGGSEKT